VSYLQGDITKAKTKLGWEPVVKFNKLVEIMVSEDIKRWEKWRRGEYSHWDAFNY
jgi:GDP-D-mannose dehydratase